MTESGLGSGALREALEKAMDALERIRASQRIVGVLVVQDMEGAIRSGRAALSLSSPIKPCEPTRGSIEWLRRLHEPPPVPTSLWPKDLTVCQKCKRDMLTNRHAVDIWGEVVCLPNVSWKEQVEKDQAPTSQASSEIRERIHALQVHKFGAAGDSWDDVEPTEYFRVSDVFEALAPSRQGAGRK